MSSFAAAALSEHPDAAQAAGEVVGQVLEGLTEAPAPGGLTIPPDRPPDLALLFVTPAHAEALGDIAATVRSVLGPVTLLGCAAESVVGGTREVERTPAVSLWAGYTGPVVAFHLEMTTTPDGPLATGWPTEAAAAEQASALLAIADPFTFRPDVFLHRMDQDRPGLPVVGGMALASNRPGGNRLLLDDQLFSSGAVAAYLGPTVRVTTVVSQGCRPIGTPFVVTKAEQNVIYELAGAPALQRLGEVAESLPEDERGLLDQGIHLGQVIDERKLDFDRGDFLVRNVIGGDPESGAIQVADLVEVGSTAQFQVRDATSADEDLRHLVGGRRADAALLFTCNGRGTRLFGQTDHDADVISESLAGAPLAGMFCAGELGPVGGRNFVHGFTAAIVLLEAGGEVNSEDEAREGAPL